MLTALFEVRDLRADLVDDAHCFVTQNVTVLELHDPTKYERLDQWRRGMLALTLLDTNEDQIPERDVSTSARKKSARTQMVEPAQHQHHATSWNMFLTNQLLGARRP